MSSADPSLSLPHQSHTVPPALTLWPHFPLFAVLYPRSPFSALIIPLAEEHPPCHPSELSAHILPHRVRLVPLALSSPQSTRPMFPSRQPAAIDINLRNFFGASTCHRVTALPSRPGVPDAREGGIRGRMWFAGAMGGRVVREEAGE